MKSWKIALIIGGGLVAAGAAFGSFMLSGSEEQTVPADRVPKSVVLTFTGDPRTSRGVTWYTGSTETASVMQLVKGKAAEESVFEEGGAAMIQGTSSSVVTDTKTGERQGVHHVEVTGLEPGTEYTYRIGTGKAGEWSGPYRFVTEGKGETPFTFINVTDSQGETEEDFEVWGRTLKSAFTMFPEAKFIVHNGDLTKEPDMEQGWDYFFREAADWITGIPLMPVAGNNDEIGGKAERFTSHFLVPDNGAKGATPGTNYSYDYGAAHFVFLNTESHIGDQTDWLKKDLAATDRPWKIAVMHRGAYGQDIYKKLDKWVEVFDEFGVDLVLQGHNHEYSRSYPLRNGKKVGGEESTIKKGAGTIYVVPNTSGPKFSEAKEDLFYHAVHFQNRKQMFVGVTVAEGELTYQAYDVEGRKLDELVIKR